VKKKKAKPDPRIKVKVVAASAHTLTVEYVNREDSAAFTDLNGTTGHLIFVADKVKP